MWALGLLPVALGVAFAIPILVAVRRVRREAAALRRELLELGTVASGVSDVATAVTGVRERASALRPALRPAAPGP